MAAFDSLPKAAFNGIPFPVRRLSVKGSLRYHIHEYPHTPGGAFENLARKLYEIRMVCPFHASFVSYPDLWPTTLATLRNIFERGDVGKLVIPTIGTIDARCIEWPEETDFKIRSGSEVQLTFLEDQSQAFLIDSLIQVDTQQMSNTADAFAIEADSAGFSPNIFAAIQSAANDVLAFVDQERAVGELFEAKLLGLKALLDEAIDDIADFDDPRNYKMLQAAIDLLDSTNQTLADLLAKGDVPQTYITPTVMAIGDISTAIYGDATHAVEILQLNSIDDAFSVPAGFHVKYYAAAA